MDMGLTRFPMLCRDLFVIGGDRRQREVKQRCWAWGLLLLRWL